MGKTAIGQQHCCNQLNELTVEFDEIAHNERRTLFVVILTAAMMIVEIIAGYMTGSMALLADGYHMASHAGALGVAYLVYKLARSTKIKQHLTFGTGKLLPLGGYSSAIGLGIIAIWMAVVSIHRLFNPVSIEFNEAIVIAVVGLSVNLLSVWILGHRDTSEEHHRHHVRDHNHESAIVHVLADAMTSVTAIIALTVGKHYSAIWLDPAMGIVGAMVILRWAYSLCKEAAWELLDGHAKGISIPDIRDKVERAGEKVLDLHLWKVGPGNLACQLIVESKALRGAEYFRKKLENKIGVTHLVVEERLAQ